MKNLLLAAFVLFSTSLIAQQLRKTPYLFYTANTHTEMKVMWQMDTTDTCSLSWGTTIAAIDGIIESLEETDTIDGHIHENVIDNLSPATQYYYKVSNDNGELANGSFLTANDTDTSVKFFVFGDTRADCDVNYAGNPGYETLAASVLEKMDAEPDCETFVIYPGDYVFTSIEKEWDSHFYGTGHPNITELHSRMPFMGIRGNHEDAGQSNLICGASDIEKFNKYVRLPFQTRYKNPKYDDPIDCYAFTYGPVKFIMVDVYKASWDWEGWGDGTATRRFIEEELNNSTKDWNIIVAHPGGYTAHPNKNKVEVHEKLQPILDEFDNAFLYFHGDVHNYSRSIVNGDSYHINISACNPYLRADTDPLNEELTDLEGNTYIIEAHDHSQNSYGLIEIEADTLRYQIIGVNDGQIIDSWSLINPSKIASTDMEVMLNDTNVELYPNPVNDILTLRIHEAPKADFFEFIVYDAQGNILATDKKTSIAAGEEIVIDLASYGLSAGVYYLKIDPQGKVVRFVKN